MKYALSAALALILFSLSVPALAGDSSLSSKTSIHWEYSDDVLSQTEKVEGEIEWTLKGDYFTFFTRVGNDWPFPGQDIRPQLLKRSVKFDMGNVNMTVGDFSVVLGRGIILSAKEDRPLGYDSMLDGSLFNVDMGNMNSTIFYGFHKTDSISEFPLAVNTIGDADLLWGGRMGYDFDITKVNLYYLHGYVAGQTDQAKDVLMGFDVAFNLCDWQFLYEHDFRDTFQGFTDGRAHYAEVSGGWPELGVTLQYKDFLNMDYVYASPPRLRRGDTEEGATHPKDEKGYMATLIYKPDFLNDGFLTGIFAASEDTQRLFPFHEFYIEYQYDPLADTTFSLGYDYIKGTLQTYNYMTGQYRDWVLGLDHSLGEDSIHLHLRFTEIDGSVGDEEENELGFDYNVGEDLTLGIFSEQSTKEFEPPPPFGDQFPTESPGRWFAFSLSYDIDPSTTLDLLWGSKRGGYECSGGVCVQNPPFRGIQVILRRYL